jgi:hypothetical protein
MKVFGQLTSVWWRSRFPCVRGRVAAEEEEEAGVETAAEETGLSGVDGGGGDRRSRERWELREFWDEKQNDTGRATNYRFENISSGSITRIVADNFGIRTEAVLI